MLEVLEEYLLVDPKSLHSRDAWHLRQSGLLSCALEYLLGA